MRVLIQNFLALKIIQKSLWDILSKVLDHNEASETDDKMKKWKRSFEANKPSCSSWRSELVGHGAQRDIHTGMDYLDIDIEI